MLTFYTNSIKPQICVASRGFGIASVVNECSNGWIPSSWMKVSHWEAWNCKIHYTVFNIIVVISLCVCKYHSLSSYQNPKTKKDALKKLDSHVSAEWKKINKKDAKKRKWWSRNLRMWSNLRQTEAAATSQPARPAAIHIPCLLDSLM